MKPFAKLKSRAGIAAHPGKLAAGAVTFGLLAGIGAGVAAVRKGPDVAKRVLERVAKTE